MTSSCNENLFFLEPKLKINPAEKKDINFGNFADNEIDKYPLLKLVHWVEKIINKHYGKEIILIDRFTDSTLAYQHYGMKLDKLLINRINAIF